MAVNKDNHSKRLNLPLPDESNFLQDDCGRIRESFNILDQNVATLDSLGKIPVDQFPAKVVQYDSADLLPEDRLPASVVLVDSTGKVPASQLPQAGLTNIRDVSSEAAMLALVATPGDVANRLDIGQKFILAAADATKLDSWRIIPQTAVTSINGETGTVTGYAKLTPIPNSSATTIDGMGGPLRLRSEGTDDYDAVTLKQLKTVQAVSGGGGGASMNGVMNNFIGAVEWFNGSRLLLPTGHIPADGDLYKRSEYPDLWAAIESGMLVSVSDAEWLAGVNTATGTSTWAHRGKYSKGTITTGPDANFRVPDLNGAVTGSASGLFLRGSGKPSTPSGVTVGTVANSSLPNITGGFSTAYSATTASGAAILEGPTGAFEYTKTAALLNKVLNPTKSIATPNGTVNLWDAATDRKGQISFDASNNRSIYGFTNQYIDSTGVARDWGDGEVKPPQAVGIWIIRANGNFSAANTSYEIINADAAEPAIKTLVKSGMVGCYYRVNGKTRNFTNLQSQYTWGNSYVSSMLGVGMNDMTGKITAETHFEFRSNGDLIAPGGIYGMVIRSDSKRGSIRNTTGGSVQSRIVNQLDNAERAAFGMYTSVGDTASELRYGNLSLTSDGKITKTWSFDMSGTFTSPGPLTCNGPINAITTGGTVSLATGIYPTYLEIGILSGAGLSQVLGARAIMHTASDSRKKTNIKTIPQGKAFADMDMVRPISFSFKANSLSENHPELPRSYGVIAQELEKVVPDAVITLSDGMKELDLTVISGFMMATIKDLMGMVKKQGEQIAKLEAKLGF